MSANKIGVDGVMIGSWAPIPSECRRILDAGCGCGIISLMLAQRAPKALISGIDIEPSAAEEAALNARQSPFEERIRILRSDFDTLAGEIKAGVIPPFDLIISNPPFFESGGNPEESKRMLARHAGSLSPEVLLCRAASCLTPEGILAFIAPYQHYRHYLTIAVLNNLHPIKACIVKGNPEVAPKRVMLAFTPSKEKVAVDMPEETLIIESERGVYTPEYIALGKPFYLNF